MTEQVSLFEFGLVKSPGDWVPSKGKRVFFKDIQVGKLYVEEFPNLLLTNKCRVILITKKTDSMVYLSDGSQSAKEGLMMESRDFIDGSDKSCCWIYEVE